MRVYSTFSPSSRRTATPVSGTAHSPSRLEGAPSSIPRVVWCPRLSFHQDLMTPLSFSFSPLHYAAVTGNTELVCYLYSEAGGPFANGKNITVASFSAGGRNGQTKWRVPVGVAPSQAASLAGHADTAKALKYFESGIPLHWDRSLHDRFEVNEFKLKAKNALHH